MPSYRTSPGFFEVPHAAVYVVKTVTVLASGFCFIQAGGASASAELLYRYGGMYATAIARHEYWRLVAYGFLHVNFVHLTMNMLCLVLWGGHLERRVGSAYFLLIYLSAMVLGAVIGNGIHSTPYLTVGASGATSGILGALLCLWILGKLDVRFDFFAINIGLNIAFAFGNSRIDWAVHLGGFAAGLITCAVLDLIEKANVWMLRCKFPEAVKVNLTLLACVMALWAWSGPAQGIAVGASGWEPVIMLAVAYCAVVKLVDLGLSMKKGLAIVVTALAGVNAAVVMLCGWALAFYCWPHMPIGYLPLDVLLVMFCPNSILIFGASRDRRRRADALALLKGNLAWDRGCWIRRHFAPCRTQPASRIMSLEGGGQRGGLSRDRFRTYIDQIIDLRIIPWPPFPSCSTCSGSSSAAPGWRSAG